MGKTINYPKLYNSNETNFNHNGIGVLKDVISPKVIIEHNGMFECEFTYTVNSFLFDKITYGSIIKINASKKLKNQLFRIYKISKEINGKVKFYAQHITYDLLSNFVKEVNLTNTTCNIALNTLLSSTVFNHKFTAISDITHTANYNIKRVNPLNAIAGSEGSIIDTFGNGCKLIRDNFNIKVMQNYGYDNNVLISYGKNITSFNSDGDLNKVVTGIYPYAIMQNGIDSNTNLNDEIIELPEQILYSSNVNKFYQPFIKPVDLSGDDVTNISQLRKKSEQYLKTINDDLKENYKISFLDSSSTSNYDGWEQLESLDLYDMAIIRDFRFNINYKVKIIKTVFLPLLDRYENMELGTSSTNLASQQKSESEKIQSEINRVNNFWQQAIEHATSQITGNSGGYVRLYPPDKPSEIFIMDKDNPNNARNILRMNKEGIGFSNNGINGPFRTAWTSDGVFYADFITAGILSAIMLQNQDGSLQIDLSSKNGIMTKQNGKRAIELAGTILKFFDWDGNGDSVGNIYSEHYTGQNTAGLSFGHLLNRYSALAYQTSGNNYKHYMTFDKYNVTGKNPYPITVNESMSMNGNLLLFDKNNYSSMYNSTSNNMVARCKNDFFIIDRDSGDNMLSIHKKGFTLYQNGNSILYTTTDGFIYNKLNFQVGGRAYIEGDLNVRGNKNCIQKTKNYGERLFYATEDSESYFTYTSPHLFNVEVTENNTYERVILIDSIYKECVNLDIDYIVDIHKVGWGDFRIKEQTKDYFIIESNSKDFEFKYTIKAKRLGYEHEFSREVFDLDKTNTKINGLDTNSNTLNTNINDLYSNINKFILNNYPNNELWRLYSK